MSQESARLPYVRLSAMPQQEIDYCVPPVAAATKVFKEYKEEARQKFLRELGRRHWRDLVALDFTLDDLRNIIVFGSLPTSPRFSIHHKHPIHGGGDNSLDNLCLMPSYLHHSLHRDSIETQLDAAGRKVTNLKAGEARRLTIPMPAGMFDIIAGDRTASLDAAERAQRVKARPQTAADWARFETSINAFFAEAAFRDQQSTQSAPNAEPALLHRILGGSDSIGANGHIFQYGNNKICVDLGQVLLPPGSRGDLAVPDISREIDSLDAIVITHGHLDHIGALPYYAKLGIKLPPIYCDPITEEYLKLTLKDMLVRFNDPRERISDTLLDIRRLEPGKVLSFGGLSVEPISVAHSIPLTSALAIKAGAITVIHSADTNGKTLVPVGPATDYARLRELGEQGVNALLLDSTRADEPGSGRDEAETARELNQILDANQGKRVVISCFASSIHRLKSICDAAARTGRKVVLEGRSLETWIKACDRAGYDFWNNNALTPKGAGIRPLFSYEASKMTMPPAKTLVVMTGNQAEPYAALTMAAQQQHRRIQLGKKDVVVMSSSIIPQNKPAVLAMRNAIKATGATLITNDDRPAVHASGHGHQDDLTCIIQAVNPRFGVPIHGDKTKRAANAALMRNEGVRPLMAGNGAVIAYSPRHSTVLRHEETEWLAIATRNNLKGHPAALVQKPFRQHPLP